MKIYKIDNGIIKTAQEIFELDGHRRDYLSIGHDSGPAILWAFKGGAILQKKVKEGNMYGHSEWEEEDIGIDFVNDFYGRFDPQSSELAIVIPEKHWGRGVPNSILKKLINEFNPSKVYYFR